MVSRIYKAYLLACYCGMENEFAYGNTIVFSVVAFPNHNFPEIYTSMVASPGETTARVSIIERLYRPGDTTIAQLFLFPQAWPSTNAQGNDRPRSQICLTPDILESRIRISETVTARFPETLILVVVIGCTVNKRCGRVSPLWDLKIEFQASWKPWIQIQWILIQMQLCSCLVHNLCFKTGFHQQNLGIISGNTATNNAFHKQILGIISFLVASQLISACISHCHVLNSPLLIQFGIFCPFAVSKQSETDPDVLHRYNRTER
jgi:hypothetical protein